MRETPHAITPTRCSCGLQQAARVLLEARLRGNFVLDWSNPSKSTFKMLDPGVSLRVLRRPWIRRYWWTLRRWLFCAASSFCLSASHAALLQRALNSAQMLHLRGSRFPSMWSCMLNALYMNVGMACMSRVIVYSHCWDEYIKPLNMINVIL